MFDGIDFKFLDLVLIMFDWVVVGFLNFKGVFFGMEGFIFVFMVFVGVFVLLFVSLLIIGCFLLVILGLIGVVIGLFVGILIEFEDL